MAVTAKFIADFSSFSNAVQQAEVDLKSFETGASKVERSLASMTDRFSGRRVIQEATLMAEAVERVGGAGKLTEAELERVGRTAAQAVDKMQALGLDVPQRLKDLAQGAKQGATGFDQLKAAAIGLGGALLAAFSVQQLLAFTRAIFDTADQLTKLSDKTGISIETLQRLGGVAEESGNSLNQITDAVTQMQKRLAGGESSTVAALNALHLSLKALLELSPEEQFTTIAAAIAKIPDPAERARVAMALFGRTGAEILPTLRADIDSIAKSVRVMSEESTRALDEFGDAWARTGKSIKTVAGEALAGAIHFASDYITQVLNPTAKATKELIEAQEALKRSLPKAPNAPTGKVGGVLTIPVPSPAEIERLRVASEAHLRATIEADKHAAAVKKIDAEYRELGNWIEERRLEFLGAQIKQAEQDTRDFNAMIAANGQALALFGRDGEQSFIQLANGARQVLEPTHTWRDSLNEVSVALGGIGDRWTAFAQGMIQQLQAIIVLWQNGFKRQAIGQAIGAIGQFIPASDNAAVSAAKFAAQGAAIGSVFPGVGTAIGAGIGALVGWAKASQAAAKTRDLIAAFERTMGGAQKMREEFERVGLSVKRVFDAKNVQQFQAAVEEYNRKLKEQEDSYARLNEAIDRYHFTIDELGPALQRQKLGEQAQQIYEDFQLLITSGIDSELVLTRMADSVNKLVQQYLTFGIDVPAALRPVIQKLIEMGLLVDQNGDLITDITQIPFAETMSAGFDRVVKAITAMTNALKRFLGIVDEAADAVSNFPTPPGDNSPPKPDEPRDPDSFAIGTHGRLLKFRNVSRITPGEGTIPRTGGGTVIIEIDRRMIAELVVPEIPGVVQRYGLA